MNDSAYVKGGIITFSGISGALFSQLFGEWDKALVALVILMVIDFLTGLTVAGIFQKSSKTFSGGLSSRVCAMGIAKKVGILLLVAVAHQADILLTVNYLRATVIAALCASEMLSIIENAGAMEILPEPVQKIFRRIIDALNNETIKHSKEERLKNDFDDDDDND